MNNDNIEKKPAELKDQALNKVSGGSKHPYMYCTIDSDLCKGCGACANSCDHFAIDVVEISDRGTFCNINDYECVGCGDCIPYCKFGAIKGHMS
ncbi:MAG: ferredoxin family protein [Lachnospiraceae bacterium]|jgi:NAD-dependent dihydropyrimidine dehydrogenase PreA subunit|nr:ferredoxin family protein [Lachnospiraceae bacterium]MDD4526400.1 ferredoxin family protein [Lachnospiraceae bacterium]NLC74270.1 4Fe-4S binding protein [Clostridiales bacterium]